MSLNVENELALNVDVPDVIESNGAKSFVLAEISSGTEAQGKGLKFAYPQYANLNGVISILGAKAILGIVNGTLKRSITAKVKHNLPTKVSDEEAKAVIAKRMEGKANGIIFSIKDADEYEYNVKEVSTTTKLTQLATAFKAGSVDQADAIAAVFQLMGIANPLLAAQDTEQP